MQEESTANQQREQDILFLKAMIEKGGPSDTALREKFFSLLPDYKDEVWLLASVLNECYYHSTLKKLLEHEDAVKTIPLCDAIEGLEVEVEKSYKNYYPLAKKCSPLYLRFSFNRQCNLPLKGYISIYINGLFLTLTEPVRGVSADAGHIPSFAQPQYSGFLTLEGAIKEKTIEAIRELLRNAGSICDAILQHGPFIFEQFLQFYQRVKDKQPIITTEWLTWSAPYEEKVAFVKEVAKLGVSYRFPGDVFESILQAMEHHPELF